MAFRLSKHYRGVFLLGCLVFVIGFFALTPYFFATTYESSVRAAITALKPVPVLDVQDYNERMLALAHIKFASTTLDAASVQMASTTATSSPKLFVATTTPLRSVSVAGKLWPAPAAYPNVGALLPFKRIVAYYGNFYSTHMGVLGEYPEDQMLAMLASTTAQWTAADPGIPAVPAVDYIAVTAQASAGFDGKYRARMPDSQIQKAIVLAQKANGIVVLDVQVGLSTVQAELPLLEQYLVLPQVHLAIDPEFSMKHGERPGTVIGTMDATDVNWSAQYLADLVRKNNLPPKVLLVHRFTEAMVTNVDAIKPLPEVQIVMDMDGFGTRARKLGTYTQIVVPEPVQFTGFKLFYKNDVPPRGDAMLTPAQVISLTPAPVFIQYQ